MIDTVLFDMDGVLIDSEPVSVRLCVEYFSSKGLKLRNEDVTPWLGAGEKVFFTGPAESHGYKVDLEEASFWFREHYDDLVHRTFPEGVRTSVLAVRHLKRLGFTLAVCTSAPRWKAVSNIRTVGLDESDFDLILSGESVRKNKPDGEIYRTAARLLSKDPSHCLVVEDSVNGLRAAEDAGMKSLGVTGTLSVGGLASAGATFIASDVGVFIGGNTMSEVIENLEGGEDRRKLYGANYILPHKKKITEISIDAMIEAAAKTREHAYTPYSNFKVGACIKSAATGRIYTGCNVENSSFGATICAERNALLNAIAQEGTIGVETLVVVSDDNPPAPPCAMCLQVLAEFTAPDSLVILSSLEGKRAEYRFSELLPNPFIFPSERK